MKRLWGGNMWLAGLWTGRLASVALALALQTVPADASLFFEETFSGTPGGSKSGKVKIVELDAGRRGLIVEPGKEAAFISFSNEIINGFRGGRGTIEFWLRRQIVADDPGKIEPILEFVNGEERNFLTLFVKWEHGDDGGAELFVDHDRKSRPKYDVNVWGHTIPLGLTPQVGEWVHVALTFGPGEGENAVYVNGVRRPPLQPAVGTNFDYQEITYTGGHLNLGGVREVRIGADHVSVRQPRSETATFMRHTALNDLRFHDEIVTTFDLSRIGIAPPSLEAVSHDAATVAGFSGKLIAGNTLGVTLQGTPGVQGSFDVAHFPDLSRSIPLDWRGWGVYLEEKVFFEEGEVNLRDVEGYRVYARQVPFDPLAAGAEPVAELDVKEQSYLLQNLEIDTPYYVAVVAVMKDGTQRPVLSPIARQPLTETAPGVYTGSWQFGYQDRYPRAVVVGRLRNGDLVGRLPAAETFAVDPALTITVASEPSVLKADEKSKAKVTVTVTDANGNPVPDHEIKFLLATTSQYTGMVGGGAFAEQVGGEINTDRRSRTDLFGRVTGTYVAGFAAKTAIIVARDMASNSTGAGHVRTFIQGTAELELEPLQEASALAAGYEISVTSSDAWLTADGKSQARITARVTLGGEPVEGHRVAFRISSGSGKIQTARETTGRDGEARAVYTAGRKIGLVLITATDTTAEISGSVQIELRSDAPAKIAITLDPEKLPADGRSRADLTVLVTDINDNPNDNVEVEYAITEGGGRLKEERGLTDRRGENENTYTAGRTPGRVGITITVRSTAPTEEESTQARGLAVAVTDYKFFR